MSSMSRSLLSQGHSVHFELSHIFHERYIEPWLLRHRTRLEYKCDLKARGTAVSVKKEEKSLAALVANEVPSAALLNEDENVGAVALLEGVQGPDESGV